MGNSFINLVGGRVGAVLYGKLVYKGKWIEIWYSESDIITKDL